MRAARSLLVATVLGGLLLAATSCGSGGKKADANDWVADICKGANDLREARASALLQFFEVDADDGPSMLDGFDRYSKKYDAALDDFESSAKHAGQPRVKDGGKVRAALEKWIQAERATNDDARAKTAKLDRANSNLAGQVEDIFAAIQFADLRTLLQESKAAGAEQIIVLIEDDPVCAFELFAEEE